MKSEEWKEVRLGDISNLSQGKQIPVEDQFHQKNDKLNRFLRIVDYTSLDEPKRYVNENNNKFFVNKDDIVIIRYGSKTAGKVVKGFCGIIANNLFRVNFKDKANKTFFYYKLSDSETINYFKNSQSSSTMPAITFDIVQNLKLLLPPLAEQKAIADTLSCIDDKIENNNKINKVLEEMAQAIFKSWFIDFEPFKDGEFVDSELGMIPKGWRVFQLKDFIKFHKGKKPNELFTENKNDEMMPYLVIDAFDNNSKLSYSYISKMILADRFDILMVMDGASSGRTHFGINGIVSSTFSVLEIEDSHIKEIIFQHLVLSYNLIKSKNTGSAIPHVDKTFILNMNIALPEIEGLIDIAETFFKIREMIINNRTQIIYLTSLRDTLLPKLMSGEIRVPYEE